jgi:hypothetical protein
MRATTSGVRFARFFGAAGILVLLSHPPAHAGSFIKVVGTRARTSVANSSITINIPSSGVSAGDGIVVTLQAGGLDGAIACSDPVNAAYGVDVVSAAGSPRIAILSKHNVAALSFGDVITCTYPEFSGASSISAYEFTGLAPAATLDQIAQSGSPVSGAASSGLTATTGQPDELVFGFLWLATPFPTQTYTPATSGGSPLESPYSPQFSFPTSIGSQVPMYRFVNAIRQYEANGTVNGSGAWKAQVVTYRLAPDLCATVDCNDSNRCTDDSCNPLTGSCTHDPVPAGTACSGNSGDVCDLTDRCDGAGVCVPKHIADGTACSEVDSECDLQDTCQGGVCTDNGVKPQGVACGDPSIDICDRSDICDGFGLCEANHLPDGSGCGDAGSQCVNADSCLDGLCHDNGFVAAGAACGDSSTGQCDGPDGCDGAGLCASNHTSVGTACDDGVLCTTADSCDESGQCAGVEDAQCLACGVNTAPIVSPVVVAIPAEPMALGSGNITLVASFTDAPGQTRSCSIDWNDDSAPDGGVVVEPSALSAGSCTASHLFTAVGVYTVTVAVTDACNEASAAVYRYAVVYDGSVGFVTGGGWITSLGGAFTPDPALTGKASFGFVARYPKGNSKVPSGVTEFHFSVANFNFQSDSYDWLVISGAKARFKGTGTVNGTGSYSFELTAWDGQESDGGGADRFRISITDLTHGNAVVYDNQINAPGGVEPTTTLGGGSIVIHRK